MVIVLSISVANLLIYQKLNLKKGFSLGLIFVKWCLIPALGDYVWKVFFLLACIVYLILKIFPTYSMSSLQVLNGYLMYYCLNSYGEIGPITVINVKFSHCHYNLRWPRVKSKGYIVHNFRTRYPQTQVNMINRNHLQS